MASPQIIDSSKTLGLAVRAAREEQGRSLRQAAPDAGVGVRFLSELERGKPTANLEKTLEALHAAGLSLTVVPREAQPAEQAPPGGFSKLLETDFPYDWSNSGMDAGTFICKVLDAGRFEDILRVAGHFGLERVSQEAEKIEDPAVFDHVTALLSRIYLGRLRASRDAAANAAR